MITRLRDWLEPEYDPTPLKKRPKVRGVFASIVISLVVWVISANTLTFGLIALWQTVMILINGPAAFIVGIHVVDWKMAYFITFGFALYVEFFSHGTMYTCYIAARYWPSLTKAILWPMIGRRHYSGTCSGRINRINIMGY